jgi:K+ transporter
VAALVFIAFGGDTSSLIPLYAVGVFLAFTLSQAGMVVHWWRQRGARWRTSIAINAMGCAMSAVVFLIAAFTKFSAGAWVSLLIQSPYCAVVPPTVAYIESLPAQRPDLTLTVIVPDLALRQRWQRLLHEDTAVRLRHALAPLSKVVVTSVPFHV